MYLTIKQQLNRLSKEEYLNLKDLSHIAKNLTNEALYNVRQTYFHEKRYAGYNENYHTLKTSENYKLLNSNMGQQILKEVDGQFQSFFALQKAKEEGSYNGKVKIPHYLEKDGYATLVIGFVRMNGNQFILPYSNAYRKDHKPIKITLPPILKDKKIKEVRLIPKCNARFFEVQYTYEVKDKKTELNNNTALAIDLGINNLATCVTSTGHSFILDGKALKAKNQWYNKQNAKLQSVKDRQGIQGLTNKQSSLITKRNNQINDTLSKSAKYIVNYCIQNKIGILVLGKNKDFQRSCNLGKRNNQTFSNIPFGKLSDKLRYQCQLYGIQFVEQEESYTSKASFFDKDEIPVYEKDKEPDVSFSGKRIKRGLYQTKDGKLINADINGALNILRKSKVVSLRGLYHRGGVDTPVRIRVS